MTRHSHLLTLLCLICAATSLSALNLSPLFGDHMVLQRNEPIAIFGRGDPGASIEVKLSNGTETRVVKSQVNPHGDYTVYLAPLAAGVGFELAVQSGDARVAFNDVMVGDVWICSGQSNMEFKLADSLGATETIAGSGNPLIRFLTVSRSSSYELNPTIEGGEWKRCDPATSPNFSAVGYYFGKHLSEELNIPVGLISSNWGGTQIESWMSQKSLLTQKDSERFLSRGPTVESEVVGPTERRINVLLETFNADRPASYQISARRRAAGFALPPSNLFNGMIHPLVDFPIKGGIWYQGESNAGRAAEYRTLFPAMITDWRRHWGIGDFPFYFAQLANYDDSVDAPGESAWAELREAQTMTLEMPETGMAVIIDIGEGDDIHPKNKNDVGYRLALQALQKTYGRSALVASGPVLQKAVPEGAAMRLYFESGNGSLVLRDQAEPSFELASAEGEFHWANAVQEGETILLKSEQVSKPAYVRYAWANNPTANLFNDVGLPASPFRTDERPGITDGNHYTLIPAVVQRGEAFSPLLRETFFGSLKWERIGDLRVAVSADDGNDTTNLFDRSLDTRWSSQGLEQSVLIDLQKSTSIHGLGMAFYLGDSRRALFKVETSLDMHSWSEQYFGMSSGTTLELETFSFSEVSARYVLITYYGNTSNLWNSVTEIVLDE